MTRPTMAELQARYKADIQGKNNNSSQKYGDIYPFWNMKFGESAIVRLLPDGNEDNDEVWFREKLMHTISIDGEDVKIPSPKMYGERDPIAELSQRYYKEGDKDSGSYYWHKRQYLVRVLVVEDPLPPDEETGENFTGKVVTTYFNTKLFNRIKNTLADDWDVSTMAEPWDMNAGYNLRIKKTKNGEWAEYDAASGFVRSPSKIPDEVQASIELIDLGSLLPRQKSTEEVEAMLHAHLTNTSYDANAASSEQGDVPAAPVTQVQSAPAVGATAPTETLTAPVEQVAQPVGAAQVTESVTAPVTQQAAPVAQQPTETVTAPVTQQTVPAPAAPVTESVTAPVTQQAAPVVQTQDAGATEEDQQMADILAAIKNRKS